MDNKKDNQKSITDKRVFYPRSVVANTLFSSDNKAFVFGYRKAERLVYATYLITNFVPTHEPIRSEVRSLSSKILSDILSLKESFQAAGPSETSQVTADIGYMLSSLNLLYAGGYISHANLELLATEYEGLAGFLVDASAFPDSENALIDKALIADPALSRERRPQAKSGYQESLEHKSFIKDKEQAQGNFNRTVSRTQKDSSLRESRKTLILNALGDLGDAQVGDIAAVVSGCSEKTIQRELQVLTDNGQVVKSGARRWTRYRLA